MNKEIKNGIKAAVQQGLLEPGDTIIITAGLPLHTAGTTNMLQVIPYNQKRHLEQTPHVQRNNSGLALHS